MEWIGRIIIRVGWVRGYRNARPDKEASDREAIVDEIAVWEKAWTREEAGMNESRVRHKSRRRAATDAPCGRWIGKWRHRNERDGERSVHCEFSPFPWRGSGRPDGM
jgi:hypothetical protein